ncbi:MAG: hypothetical protein RIB61_14830 [Roseicyclus sp.]|jgi:hypothetical protein
MRFVLAAFICLASLAACTTGPAAPRDVQIDRDLLTVGMSDGSLCRGAAPGDSPAGWSGTLQSCPWSYGYTVEIDPGTNPVRLILQEVFTALGAPDALSPIATVTIIDGMGRARVFETPDGLVD